MDIVTETNAKKVTKKKLKKKMKCRLINFFREGHVKHTNIVLDCKHMKDVQK